MLDGGDPTLDGPRPGEPADIDGSGGHGAASSDTTAPRIGAYTVLRLLGKGGMGAVYEAEQKHPRRLVALKVIRASFATPSLLKRFEHESHVLGCLKHPGIAQIYQAGSLKDRHGRTTPYFAMELVAGETLTRHAETHGLDMRQRLALLARVCDAVNHAHQKGVIHRDLKPANVLVDRDGQPKILDFGVARATDGDVQQVT
ncbi:MAG: serine/threonine-protein kinase, partial [Phycisphaerales bacterium]